MHVRRRAAYSLVTLLAVSGHALGAEIPESNSGKEQQVNEKIDEIIVEGSREITSRSATVAVESTLVIDTASALKQLPGGDVNRNGRLSGIAQYRGLYGDRVGVSIDGIGVIGGGPNAMDAPLSYVSPMITESLVLERGIPGVASTPDAIGGNIDVHLARGSFGDDAGFGLSGMAGARYFDNGDATTAAGRLTLANRSHRMSIVGQADRADDQETPVGTIIPSRLSRDRYDLSYAYDDGAGELLVYAGGLDTRDTGTPALAMDIRYIDTMLYGFKAERQVSTRWRLAAGAGYNDVDHVMDNFSLRPPPPTPMAYRQNRTGGSGTLLTLAAEGQYRDTRISLGVDGRFASHDSLITNPDNANFFIENFNDIERDVVAMYLAAGQEKNGVTWELGLRQVRVDSAADAVAFGGLMGGMGDAARLLADAFNAAERRQSFSNLDAVFNFEAQLASDLTATVDLGSRARAPSYQELYLWLPLQATGGLADGRNYVGNLGLRAERSREIVLGLDWSAGSAALSPQVYYRRIDDYIQGVPADSMPADMLAGMMSGNGALRFDNVDAEIYGFDLALSYTLSPRVRVDAAAGYARGKRRDVADNLYRIAPLNGSLAVTYMASAFLVRTEVVAYAAQEDVSRYNDELPTAGYGIVNLHGSWQLGPSTRLELSADNLFDRGYQDHLAGVNRVRNAELPTGQRLFGAGRTVGAGVVIEF